MRADGKRVALASSATADKLKACEELAGIGELGLLLRARHPSEMVQPHEADQGLRDHPAFP